MIQESRESLENPILIRGSLQTNDSLRHTDISVYDEEKATRRRERDFFNKIQNRLEVKKYGRVLNKNQQPQRSQR